MVEQGEYEARDKDGSERLKNFPQTERSDPGEEHVAGASKTSFSSNNSHAKPIFPGGEDENDQRAPLFPSQHSRGEALWHHRRAEQHMVRKIKNQHCWYRTEEGLVQKEKDIFCI